MKQAIPTIIAALVVLLVILGAVYFESPTRKAEARVRELMRDPDSTQFRYVRSTARGNETLVCGEVNAKNGFGAYHGFVPFLQFAYSVRYATDKYETIAISACCAFLEGAPVFDKPTPSSEIAACESITPRFSVQ